MSVDRISLYFFCIANISQKYRQKSITITQKKTTTLKRPKQSLKLTPLKRQVMTKSIHRAILQYQHSQCGIESPRSPLDLRVRSSLMRGPKHTCSPKSGCNKCSPATRSKRLQVISTKQSTTIRSLDTVYEQVKRADGKAREKQVGTSSEEVNEMVANNKEHNAIEATPISTARNQLLEFNQCNELPDNDEIWHTPNEFIKGSTDDNTNAEVSVRQTKS